MGNKLRYVFAVLAGVFFVWVITIGLAACSVNGNGNNDGDDACPPCGEGEVCDQASGECVPGGSNGNGQNGSNGSGGTPDGPPPCASDFDDCEQGEVCDLETGECVEGFTCDPEYGNANCNWNMDTNSQDPGWGCGGDGGDSCVCDPRDNICRKRRQPCEPCEDNEECGPHYYFSNPAECVLYDGDNVCLALASARGCPSGYVSSDGVCVPAEGSCADVFACVSDADCPEERPVCHLSSGTCRPGCTFDSRTGETRGCPPNQVCHGDGRCRSECEQDSDCTPIQSDFVCHEEHTGVKRCRIDGCLHDIECPVPSDGPYLGFCDLTTNTCYDDRCLQTNFDGSSHEEPHRHCRSGYACRDDNVCEQMACTERSAASIACGRNQFCCGFCRNATGNPERDECDPTPCPDSFDTPEGAVEGCFLAEKDKWCVGCESNEECASIDNPTNDSRDENLCYDSSCLLTCETQHDCPIFWNCSGIYISCETSADCGDRGAACVRLDEDDEESPMFCSCANGGDGNDALCPDDTRCLRGIASHHLCGLGMFCLEQAPSEEERYCQ